MLDGVGPAGLSPTVSHAVQTRLICDAFRLSDVASIFQHMLKLN